MRFGVVLPFDSVADRAIVSETVCVRSGVAEKRTARAGGDQSKKQKLVSLRDQKGAVHAFTTFHVQSDTVRKTSTFRNCGAQQADTRLTLERSRLHPQCVAQSRWGLMTPLSGPCRCSVWVEWSEKLYLRLPTLILITGKKLIHKELDMRPTHTHTPQEEEKEKRKREKVWVSSISTKIYSSKHTNPLLPPIVCQLPNLVG